MLQTAMLPNQPCVRAWATFTTGLTVIATTACKLVFVIVERTHYINAIGL